MRPVTSSLLSHVFPPESLLSQQRFKSLSRESVTDTAGQRSPAAARVAGVARLQSRNAVAGNGAGLQAAVGLNTEFGGVRNSGAVSSLLTADDLLDWQRQQIVQLQQLLQQSRLQLLLTQVSTNTSLFVVDESSFTWRHKILSLFGPLNSFSLLYIT